MCYKFEVGANFGIQIGVNASPAVRAIEFKEAF